MLTRVSVIPRVGHWQMNSKGPLTAVGWVLRVLAWTFAALFIAGFTSAVRKT